MKPQKREDKTFDWIRTVWGGTTKHVWRLKARTNHEVPIVIKSVILKSIGDPKQIQKVGNNFKKLKSMKVWKILSTI